MMINKLLADNGYIFVKDVSVPYLKALIAIGCKPILVKVEYNTRDIIFLDRITKGSTPMFRYDPCSISEIKSVLKYIKQGQDNYIASNINGIMYIGFSDEYLQCL